MMHALFSSPVLNTITIPTVILITSIKEFKVFASEFVLIGTVGLLINDYHTTLINKVL